MSKTEMPKSEEKPEIQKLTKYFCAKCKNPILEIKNIAHCSEQSCNAICCETCLKNNQNKLQPSNAEFTCLTCQAKLTTTVLPSEPSKYIELFKCY